MGPSSIRRGFTALRLAFRNSGCRHPVGPPVGRVQDCRQVIRSRAVVWLRSTPGFHPMRGAPMRGLFLAACVAAIASPTAAAAPRSYHVIAQLPAGDGGWDIASVDPLAHRLYIGRTDGVTAIDLAT